MGYQRHSTSNFSQLTSCTKENIITRNNAAVLCNIGYSELQSLIAFFI